LAKLEFSIISGEFDAGAKAVANLADRYQAAAEHLLRGHLANTKLKSEMHSWWEAFELGAAILRRIATLAENRQLETPQVLGLEVEITRLRSLGKRVFGDSLDMAIDAFVERVRPSPSP
jgi:hypothetical protein